MADDPKPDPDAEREELKSERVQLLMAPSELKAIDDWSFSNRIRSRAEAIRRLCNISLLYDARYSSLEHAIKIVSEALEDPEINRMKLARGVGEMMVTLQELTSRRSALAYAKPKEDLIISDNAADVFGRLRDGIVHGTDETAQAAFKIFVGGLELAARKAADPKAGGS